MICKYTILQDSPNTKEELISYINDIKRSKRINDKNENNSDSQSSSDSSSDDDDSMEIEDGYYNIGLCYNPYQTEQTCLLYVQNI